MERPESAFDKLQHLQALLEGIQHHIEEKQNQSPLQRIKNLLNSGELFNMKLALRLMVSEGIVLPTLDLRAYNLTEIPKELFSCKGLQKVEFGYDTISTIPDDLLNLETLEELVIVYNKTTLEYLPFDYEGRCALKKIDLYNTELSSQALQAILSYPNLERIHIDTPSDLDLSNFSSDKMMYGIDWNKVWKSYFNTSKIKSLNLSNSQLNNLSFSGCYFATLTELDLSNNHLEEICIDLYLMPYLEKLNLSYNPLKKIEIKGANNAKLTELHLSVTSNLDLENRKDLLLSLPKLQHIHLSKEEATQIPDWLDKYVK